MAGIVEKTLCFQAYAQRPLARPKHSPSFSDKASAQPAGVLKTGRRGGRKLATPGTTRVTAKETAMNVRTCLVLLSLSASFGAASIHATEAPVGETDIVVDCAKPALPSQREVGEMTGQYNFSQVYATRARLMAEAHRACQRDGVARVRLVMAPPAREPARTIAQRSAPR
jgi:hypothetical protein